MQNNPTPKKSTFETNITASVTPENRVKITSTKNTVETEHPVYKTKILVVTGNEPELDYAGIAKSKISEITKILPINIPRSLVAILFVIVVIPIIFSPGIFIPDFSIAGGEASMSQLKFPETIFRNLNFDNRQILKAQLDTLVSSYERKLAILDCDCDLAKLLKSRIKIAQAIWENASDDLFLDFMMAQISDIKTKPYFSYSNPCFTYDRKKINTHFNSLGKWARDTDQMDFERQIAEFMVKYPEIFEKANFDRLENINAVIAQAVNENAFVAAEIKTIAVEKKAVKKHKKRRHYNKSAKAKAEKPAEKKAAEVSTSTPAPVEAVPAPAPAPAAVEPAPAPVEVKKEEPKKEEPKKAKDAKKDKKAKAEAPAAPVAAPAPEQTPAPAQDAAAGMPPAPETMPAPPADAAMTPADPTMPPAPAEPAKTDAKGAKKPAKIK